MGGRSPSCEARVDRFSSNLSILLGILGAAAAMSGCSGARVTQLETELGEVRGEIVEMKRNRAAERLQFAEVRDRLVMVEEQVDAERVALARRDDAWMPAVPTVRVQPAGRSGHRGKTRAVAAAPAVAKPVVVASGPAGEPAPQEVRKSQADPAVALYAEAKALLDQGQHDAARALFDEMVLRHGRHELADNALYWVGESWYAQSQWLAAAQTFLRVAQTYPRGNKVPDALYKLGLTYLQLGDDKGAAEVLDQLARTWPGTELGQRAAQRLKLLRRPGR
jgi:tol-pal system protein YbgF